MYLVDVVLHVRSTAFASVCTVTTDPLSWFTSQVVCFLGDRFGPSSLESAQLIGCSLTCSLQLENIPVQLVMLSLEEMSLMISAALERFPTFVKVDHIGVIFIAQRQ